MTEPLGGPCAGELGVVVGLDGEGGDLPPQPLPEPAAGAVAGAEGGEVDGAIGGDQAGLGEGQAAQAGGEFVFELAAAQEQALSSDSGQLDAQASALAKRLDEAKTAAQAPTAKAVQVKLQGLDGKEVAIAAPTAKVDPGARVAAQRANDRGLQLYKERRYEEAEAAFTEALKLQPRFALAANNLGFIYYKRGMPVEAARWYQKALEMDGSRSMAWLNLGDAQLQAGDDIAALVAYKSFVELAPQHPRTAELRAWIAQPDAAHRPKLPS